MRYSYVTALTTDNYFPGLCSLSHSLKKANTQYPLSVIVPTNLSDKTKQLISQRDIQLIELDPVVIDDNLLQQNLEKNWNNTFFKLSVFNLTQFDKVVYLDLDMIIKRNIDELFEAPHMSCVAAGKCIHPDWTRLNSGIMVIEPSNKLFEDMLMCSSDACKDRISNGLGFGDQDIINYYYPDWSNCEDLHLSEVYNSMSSCIEELSRLYGYDNLKVLHYIDSTKPWQYSTFGSWLYILKRVVKRQWHRIKGFEEYRNYLKESCPDYKSFANKK